jgi:hypothetical protein
VAALAALVTGMTTAHAFDFGDMMDPGEWFGDDDDWYERGYYGGPYGPYGPYGWGGPYGYGPYGGGPYGGPYGPYGYGGPYGGWGGGYPGAIVVNPSQGSSAPPPPRTPE